MRRHVESSRPLIGAATAGERNRPLSRLSGRRCPILGLSRAAAIARWSWVHVGVSAMAAGDHRCGFEHRTGDPSATEAVQGAGREDSPPGGVAARAVRDSLLHRSRLETTAASVVTGPGVGTVAQPHEASSSSVVAMDSQVRA
jgi:hypothetical protein